LPVESARTIEEQIAPATAQDQTVAQIAVVFGSVALALAATRLYGVLACGVARRRREIAIRIAVGARRRDDSSGNEWRDGCRAAARIGIEDVSVRIRKKGALISSNSAGGA
jgi:hypothetical protein